MSKGLKKMIRDQLPETWESVLRQEKCLMKFIDMMYNSIPPDKRGRKLTDGKISYKKGVMYIYYAFKNLSMIKCIQPELEKFGNQGIDWQEIQMKINLRDSYNR